MKYQVVDTLPGHVDAVIRNIRQADVDEIWASAAILPRDALYISLKCAEVSRTWLIDGCPAAIGGVGVGGVIWLITTDLVERHQRQFLAESHREMEKVKLNYERLFNFVDVRNLRAIRWLQWMGFTMSKPIRYGVFRKLFLYFEWCNDVF